MNKSAPGHDRGHFSSRRAKFIRRERLELLVDFGDEGFYLSPDFISDWANLIDTLSSRVAQWPIEV